MRFKKAFKELYQDAKEKYNIKQAPKLILRKDEDNAKKLFGRPAFYDTEDSTIVVSSYPFDINESLLLELDL